VLNIVKKENSTRIELVENNEIKSGLTVHNLKVFVWGKILTAGGIGGVFTKEEYRHHGFSKIVLDEALKVMLRDGQDLALLFGIPDYYYRWGFVSCLSQNHISIPTYQAERATMSHLVRPLNETDYPQIISLYQQNNKFRTGAIVRDFERFRFRLGSHFGEKAEVYVVTKDANIEGYLVLDQAKRRVNLVEIEAQNPAVYYSSLAFLAKQAIDKRVSAITGNIPWDHPFALIARDYGLSVTINYVYNADGMGRIISQAKVLKTLAPEIFINCSLSANEVTLIFSTELGQTKIGQGLETHLIETDQKTLMQLLFGYQSAKVCIYEKKLSSRSLSMAVLEEMFSTRISHLYGPDKF